METSTGRRCHVTSRKKFYNPSQSDDSDRDNIIEKDFDEDVDIVEPVNLPDEKLMEKNDKPVVENIENLRCNFCNYDAPDKQKLEKHTFEKHSVKGYICIGCKDEFDSWKRLTAISIMVVDHSFCC